MSLPDPVWVGIDVGGTRSSPGWSRPTAGPAHRPTLDPRRLAEVSELEEGLTEALLEVADGAPVAGVGLAAAGFVDSLGDRVMFAPHLPWRDDPVRPR